MGHPMSSQDVDDAIRGLNADIEPDELDDLLLAVQEDIEDERPERVEVRDINDD